MERSASNGSSRSSGEPERDQGTRRDRERSTGTQAKEEKTLGSREKEERSLRERKKAGSSRGSSLDLRGEKERANERGEERESRSCLEFALVSPRPRFCHATTVKEPTETPARFVDMQGKFSEAQVARENNVRNNATQPGAL